MLDSTKREQTFGVLVMMYVSECHSIGNIRGSRNAGGERARYRASAASKANNRKRIAAARYGAAALFFLLLFSGFMILSSVASEKAPAPAQVSESVVIVSSGETLWDIASEWKEDGMDTRRAVYAIKKRNGLDSSEVMSGQKLVIPAW